jgi:uncharacterized membrane protein
MPSFRRQPGSSRPRLSRGDVMLVAATVVAVIAIGLITLLAQPAAARALTQATTQQPEHFTELYFMNHITLPKVVTAGVPASFTYRIVNHETTTTIYHPQVQLVENGQTHTLNSDTFQLTDGALRDTTISFTASQPGSQLELIVNLPEQHQIIHFRSHS